MDKLDVIKTYCAAWDEPDPAKREELLREVWTDGSVYEDPTVRVTGIEALSTHIATVQERLPGSRLSLTSDLDMHHDVGYFYWRKVLADGTELQESVDFVEFLDDGRLSHVVGFFGTPKRSE